MSDRPRAAYVHIPFCASKCWYCDFSSYPGLESIFGDYVRALVAEIDRSGRHGGDGEPPPRSVYFGGGTPTILDVSGISAILDAISRGIGIDHDAEVTIEANPGTVDLAKLSALREMGFNRLSLGVQSFDDEFLRSIGRAHTSAQALDAYAAAREAGFTNVGIDLIFALPGQTLEHWARTLDIAMALDECSGRSPSRPGPEHISLYELSIEEGTRFGQLCADGKLAPIDEDTRVDMYELAIGKLTSAPPLGRDSKSRPNGGGAGYEHYEVSNFARPGCRSRHNTTYWLNDAYFGFGAGATSYVDGTRARRIADPRQYVAAIGLGAAAIEFSETLDARARLGETMVQGLRMLEGIDLARIRLTAGFDPLHEYASEIEALTAHGLIEVADGRLRVTHRGLLLLNDVAAEFV